MASWKQLMFHFPQFALLDPQHKSVDYLDYIYRGGDLGTTSIPLQPNA